MIFCKLAQFWNIAPEIEVNVFGSTTDDSFVHPENTLNPIISVIPSSNITCLRFSHPQKAAASMVRTLQGIIIEVKFLHPENAL